jgi:hypothetical protein
MDDHAKDGPHAEIPSDHQTYQQRLVLPLACEAVKQRHQRQTRGQHHGHNHQDPTHHNDQHHEAVTEVSSAQFVMVEQAPVGGLSPEPQRQPSQDN